MSDRSHQARVAALSIAQLTTVVKFLRANGETEHAEKVEAAQSAVTEIVRRELGQESLAQAIEWISQEIEGAAELCAPLALRH